MSCRTCKLFTLVCLLFHGSLAAESLPGTETEDAWFDDDWETRAEAVSNGELRFLTEPPDKPGLMTRNYLTITADSLTTGWLLLDQCQGNLDSLPSVEISYQYQNIRDLRIVTSRNIGKAAVNGQTIHLEDVGQDAIVCMRAEVRILKELEPGLYQVRSGPFYRRFLDGYYPVHIDYRLQYPDDILTVRQVNPARALTISQEDISGEVVIDTWFEGKLSIEVLLEKRS